MDDASARLLFVHGALVLLVGVLCGYGFWLHLITGRPEARTRPWRVAHATLLSVGLTMLMAGLLQPHLALTPFLRTLATRCLVVSGWSFSFALIGGALVGIRGLTPRPWGLNAIFFAGHALGAAGSTVGVALIACGLLARS